MARTRDRLSGPASDSYATVSRGRAVASRSFASAVRSTSIDGIVSIPPRLSPGDAGTVSSPRIPQRVVSRRSRRGGVPTSRPSCAASATCSRGELGGRVASGRRPLTTATTTMATSVTPLLIDGTAVTSGSKPSEPPAPSPRTAGRATATSPPTSSSGTPRLVL